MRRGSMMTSRGPTIQDRFEEMAGGVARKHRLQDDQRAAEVASLLVRLREVAAGRVPGWSPELREENRRTVLRYSWVYPY